MKYEDLRPKNYKYRLMETIAFQVNIFPSGQEDIKTDWLHLSTFGTLTIRAGYCWDGASGPAWDTKNLMTPSLVHDAGYQLIRLGLLPRSTRTQWDDLLYEMCKVRGMNRLRRTWIRVGVGLGGRPSVEPDYDKDVVQIVEVE